MTLHQASALGPCSCGRALSRPQGDTTRAEAACECGRRIDLRRAGDGWIVEGELTPEGSVPVDGFSREIRLRSDVERFWFPLTGSRGVRFNVHLVFSSSAKSAEVKHSDVKALRMTPVETPTEARRRWLLWWQARGAASGRLPGAPDEARLRGSPPRQPGA